MTTNAPDSPSAMSNRWALVSLDAGRATEFLRAICDLDRLSKNEKPARLNVMREGLLFAAIVSYCRGFLHSRSIPYASSVADFKQLPTSADANLLALHESLVEKRNTAVAHSDWKSHTTTLHKQDVGTVRIFPHAPYWTGISLADFIRLTRRVQVEAMDASRCLDNPEFADLMPVMNSYLTPCPDEIFWRNGGAPRPERTIELMSDVPPPWLANKDIP